MRKAGVLVKNAAALEHAEKIQVLIVDKTGTLTEGKPVVTDIVPAGSIMECDLMQIAVNSRTGIGTSAGKSRNGAGRELRAIGRGQ